jgi:hypothetical protein
MKVRRIVLWGTAAGLVAGVGSAQIPTAFGHEQGGVRSPTAAEIESLPDFVPALDAEGNVVACIKNPVKYPDDPESLWWPPGLDASGLVGSYAVEDADGKVQMTSEQIDVSAAVANAQAQIQAQSGQAKDC